MAKSKKYIDTDQTTLFDILKSYQEQNSTPKLAGSLQIDQQFRDVISGALRDCRLSRYQVAGCMSELTGTDITKTMLDSWTAESKEQHRFPAIFLPAFCEAVGTHEPLKLLGQLVGVFILPGSEALRSEIRRIDEEIGRKRAEKKRRLTFLQEMEAEK